MRKKFFLDKEKELEIAQAIGQQLREIRTVNGYRLEDIASSAGISFQQLQKYERGTCCISIAKLYAFSCIFEVCPQYFFETLPDVPQICISDANLFRILRRIQQSPHAEEVTRILCNLANDV